MTNKNGIKPQYTCEYCEKQAPVIVQTVIKIDGVARYVALCKACFMDANNA